jgi:hypothetical protein
MFFLGDGEGRPGRASHSHQLGGKKWEFVRQWATETIEPSRCLGNHHQLWPDSIPMFRVKWVKWQPGLTTLLCHNYHNSQRKLHEHHEATALSWSMSHMSRFRETRNRTAGTVSICMSMVILLRSFTRCHMVPYGAICHGVGWRMIRDRSPLKLFKRLKLTQKNELKTHWHKSWRVQTKITKIDGAEKNEGGRRRKKRTENLKGPTFHLWGQYFVFFLGIYTS